jgi:transcriptional regulator with XRE-family HTH domain
MPVSPLKRAIFESQRTQRDIASQCEIHEGTLSRIVNGLHADDAMRQRIAEALGREVHELWPMDVAA